MNQINITKNDLRPSPMNNTTVTPIELSLSTMLQQQDNGEDFSYNYLPKGRGFRHHFRWCYGGTGSDVHNNTHGSGGRGCHIAKCLPSYVCLVGSCRLIIAWCTLGIGTDRRTVTMMAQLLLTSGLVRYEAVVPSTISRTYQIFIFNHIALVPFDFSSPWLGSRCC